MTVYKCTFLAYEHISKYTFTYEHNLFSTKNIVIWLHGNQLIHDITSLWIVVDHPRYYLSRFHSVDGKIKLLSDMTWTIVDYSPRDGCESSCEWNANANRPDGDFAPSRDVFVAQRRREWRWARKPNYELFSPRHGAPLYRRCTHLPGASPFTSRKSEKELGSREESRGLKRVVENEREDVSAGFPPPLMGMRYELFVGCSLAFSHCYATVLLASPSCTPTKGINVNARCRAALEKRTRERECWNNDWVCVISGPSDQNRYVMLWQLREASEVPSWAIL